MPKHEAEEEEMKVEEKSQEEQMTEERATEEKEGSKVEEKAPPKIIEIAEDELERFKEEAQSFKEKYWLLLAESENQRKRMQKERQEHVSYAVKNMIVEMLQPIDSMGNALGFTDQMSEEVKNWAAGFQMILTQFKDVLANQGVHSYESEGLQFDPHLHEAVETLETDEVEDGTVVQEFVKGYKMGERIIRPARVKVAKKPAPEKAETVGEAENQESEEENTQ